MGNIHWQEATVWLSGATGFWGHEFCRQLLTFPIHKLIAFCRSEHRAADLAAQFPDERLRIHLGDVRDFDRIRQSLYHTDYILHAAALKRIESGSYNPFEMYKTNITGSANVVNAALTNATASYRAHVALLISSDKAYQPTTTYGATKLVAEALWHGANIYSPSATRPRFRVIRCGNVLGSTGSVLHIWRSQMNKNQPLTITDPHATRFHLTVREAVAYALRAMDPAIETPPHLRMPAYTIGDLATAFAGADYPKTIIGSRGYGEKKAETLDEYSGTSEDAPRLSVTDLRDILTNEGWL